jgi:NADPH:quinone reductase-like Zn-dependent oxidoreductase
MRHWSFDNGFGYDNLVLREADTPRPGPRDVLLEMRAASLNYRDLVVLRGQHGRRVQPPLIPLSDGVGTVIETGPTSPTCKPGDRVAPAFFQNWEGGPPPADLEAGRLGGPLDGVLATHRVFPARGVLPVPDHLTDAEAATLPCAGVTAWSAIIGDDPVRPGETVLILGSGGVALMAILLAKTAGARTIVTTSSAGARRKGSGAWAPTTSSTAAPRPTGRPRRAADRRHGVDRVIELGGAATLPSRHQGHPHRRADHPDRQRHRQPAELFPARDPHPPIDLAGRDRRLQGGLRRAQPRGGAAHTLRP